MFLPLWLLALLGAASALAVLLAFLLWSGRSQRPTRVRPGGLEPLDALLPAVEGLSESWAVAGNDLELFDNGDGFFPALLADVEAAETSIHLEVYAWWKGEICHRLTAALCRRAAAGVEVRLLVDALGAAPMERQLVRHLQAAGCRLVHYHPFVLRSLGRLNKRDHRKLAIFDGRWGWVFGHGIAAEWEGNGDAPDSWRDLAVRLTGPVVTRLQAVFAQQWMEESAELLAASRYFPPLAATGEIAVQVIYSSPRGGVSDSSILYRLMIATARDELIIQNPYFAPSREVVELLEEAAGRGVAVRLLLPGPVTDSRLVQRAGQRFFDPLLAAGVEIHEFQPTLNHQKVMIVDRRWAYLGSANFDERSFDINAEVGLGIADEAFCEQLRRRFEADLGRSRHLELASWRRRPLSRRLAERAAFLLHEQL